MMAKQHDISGMGDPWIDGAEPEGPDLAEVQGAHDQLTALIDGLPSGGLSGGRPAEDDFDPRTWKGPEGDEMREFLGEPAEGLTQAEKLELHRQGSKQIAQASADDFERTKQAQATADSLWSDFQRAHPGASQNPQAVEQAANRVVKQLQAEGDDPASYLQNNRADFLADVAHEVERAPSGGGGGGRTEMLSDGGGGARRASGNADDPGDMLSDIRSVQSRDGFH